MNTKFCFRFSVHRIVQLFIICSCIFPSKLFATTYYVTSSGGNDSYNGLAATWDGTNGPWQSLTKVSAHTFSAGDNVLLKTGDTWTGQVLLLKGLGSRSNPITLSTYGSGAMPIISPQITDSYAITVHNTAGWKIIGLEITKARAAIALQYDMSFNNNYMFINNCNIHDIDNTYNSSPNLYNHISSGILLEGYDTASILRYHLIGLTVQNITFQNVNSCWWVGCIASHTNSSGFGSNNRFDSITISNLSAHNCSQWGYSFTFMEDAQITNADCDNTGYGTNPYGAAGFVVAYSKRVTLDGCDSYNSHRGAQNYDGDGFDFEGGLSTSNVTFKNATIDHSDGCGIFVFNNGGTGGTQNILVDHVIISHFGENPGNSSAGIDFSSPGNSSGTVQNTVFNRSVSGNAFYTGYPSTPSNFTFTNNTFNDITGLNLAPIATLTASTTDVGNGYSTAKAVDGNPGDFQGWSSTVGVPQWLQLTWSTSKSIHQVQLYTTTGYYLKDYDIQYWDGSAWQTLSSVRNNAQKLVVSNFTPIVCTQMRIYCITPDQTQYCRIDEIQVYGDSATASLLNASFELPATSTYQYGPFTNGWTFDGASGVQHNGSGWGAPNAPDGVQTAFLQGLGTIVQTINFPDAGTFHLNFKCAKRSVGGTQSFSVYIDATLVSSYTPSSTSFTNFITSDFTVSPGSHTIHFVGTTSADNTDFIDSVSIVQTKMGNGGFETPSTSTYMYGPFTNGWTFDAASGIQHNGSAWGAPSAPEGVQTAFIQHNGSITQSMNFPSSGSYTINFQAAKRTSFGGTESFDVYVDGMVVSSFTPSSGSFTSFATSSFSVTAGRHQIEFLGTTTGDNTDFIDAVYILNSSGVGVLANESAFSENPDAEPTEKVNAISVYPNPAHGNISLIYQLPSNTETKFYLYNINGALVKKISLTTNAGGSGKLDINTNELSIGTYVLKTVSGNFSKSVKLLIAN